MYRIDLDLIFSAYKHANIRSKMGIVGAGESRYVFVLDERNEPSSHFRSDLQQRESVGEQCPKICKWHNMVFLLEYTSM